MTEEEIEEVAILLIDALATAAFKAGAIQPVKVWDRVQSAVQSAATGCDDYGSFIEDAARSLQIDSFDRYASRDIADVHERVTASWDAVRQAVERKPRFLVAMTRAARDERKAEKEAQR